MPELLYTAVAGRSYLPYVAYLKKWLPEAVAKVPKVPAEISISLVGDTKMAALHVRFLKIAGPTDVLTFEVDHDARGRCTAGEVVVCVPYAKRQATRRAIDVRHELLLYALHGVLHLAGYDDRTPADHERIHAAEDRILEAIGVGPVFDRSKPAPR